MLKAEVIEILLYGCVTWTVSAQHFARLRSAHHQVLLPVIGFQRRQRTDSTTLSYAKALKETRCESIETKSWHRCLLDDLKAFDATKGSTEHSKLVFGVEAEVWTVAAKKVGKWCRGVLEAAERFMAKWHENEATLSRIRQASATGGAQGNRKGGGNSRREIAVDESRKEMAVRVARHQAD